MPKVVAIQWALAVLSLMLAASSYLLSTYEDLASLALALGGLNLVLLVHVTVEMARTRLVGKFVLVASTVFYFWVGAVTSSRVELPFPMPAATAAQARQFTVEHVQLAFVYIALFQLMLLAGYSLRPRVRKLIRVAETRVDSTSHNARVLRYALAACALIPFLLIYGFDIGDTIEALLGARRESSVEARDIGLLHFLLFFGMFGAALFLVETFIARSVGKLRNFLIGVVTVLPFVLGGTRHLWLYISLPVCLFVFRRLRGRLTITLALRLCAIPLVILVVMQLQYTFRTYGWGESVTVESTESVTDADVTGQFTALLFAEHLVPDKHDYFMELAEPFFVIHWIPRQVWPEKPVMQSWAYYNDAYVQGYFYNVTPSVIGQFHLNWGIYGVVFIGLWLGALVSIADRLLLVINVETQRAMAVVVGMLYAFIISSFRFYSPIYFAYLLFAIIAMWLITRRGERSSFAVGEISYERMMAAAPRGAMLPPRF